MKKKSKRTVPKTKASRHEALIDRLINEPLDVPVSEEFEDDRDVAPLDMCKLYESMDASWEDAILRGITGETSGHDYYGGKGLGDVEPEVPAKVRRKTARPKPKRKR
jgi:hypothetical protein